MQTLTPLAIAAVLLTQFIIAQHIGLRALSSLREAIGVGATVICTLLIAAVFDWMLLHYVLQPFDIVYLRLFISVILTAAITPLVEVMLRSRFAQFFPPVSSLLPLTMTTCCTLVAAQTIGSSGASPLQAGFSAIGLSLGAAFLLMVLQGLRECSAEKLPKTVAGIARDVLNAAFIFVALVGVLSIWR